MAKENETIAEIIAEMRGDGHTGPADALEWVRIKLEYYADRLEAAHKRELHELRAENEYLKQERNQSGVRERRRLEANGFAIVPKDKLEAVGNCAKLSEALRECAQYIACVGGIGIGEITINDKVHLAPEELMRKAIAALAATEKKGGAK